MYKKKNLSRTLAAILAPVVLLAGLSLPAAGQNGATRTVPVLITAPVDPAARTVITHSTHPLVQHAAVVGAVDNNAPMERMMLVLGPGEVQEQQARAFLDGLHTQGSPSYHQWLTPEQFGQKFGPSPADLQQVKNWLTGQGFSVTSVARSGRWIEFSGSTATVQTAFGTRMLSYTVNGELHTANAGDISIPAALTPVVRGVLSLHNFYSKPSHRSLLEKAAVTLDPANPAITLAGGKHAIVPADFAKIYHLNPLYGANLNGAGQTIAIVAASNIDVSDVANFRSLFGLPVNPPNIILNGPDPGLTGDADQAEASLDTEWAGAIAPKAAIDVVVSSGTLTTDPIALGASYVVDQNLAQILNVSFNFCEDSLGVAGNVFWNSLWEQAAAQGISVFVSAGDTGAAGCDSNAPSSAGAGGTAVNGFASTPFNTSVGGTQFNETANGGSADTFWQQLNGAGDASALGYIPESAWNESCAPSDQGSLCQLADVFFFLAGGGGVSTVYSTPSYQTLPIHGLSALNGFSLPNSLLHPRGQPDVSLASGTLHDPYVFCFSPPGATDCATINGVTHFNSIGGGTSFAAPAFAGIMAIVDQKVGSSQGLANYVLYSLAAAENPDGCNASSRINPAASTACVFNDTTTAGNGVPGNDVTNYPTPGALGFPSIPGYDLATGLGSVDATNLVNAWASAAGNFQGSATTIAASYNGTPLPSGTVNIIHGKPVSVNVSVARQSTSATATPTGNVSLIAYGGSLPAGVGLGFAPLAGSGGTASSGSVLVNNLPGGANYNLSAVFPGDGVLAGSTSAPIVVTVSPESTTTALQSLILSPNGLAAGNTVAYGDGDNILAIDAQTVGISGLVPSSGKVSVNITGNPVFPIAVNNAGMVEIQNCFSPLPQCLPPGTYTVTASYTGDGQSYNGSKSPGISITVTAGNPTVNVSAPASILGGQPVTVSANVILPPLGSITPTGAVQFFDASGPLGKPVPLNSGQATASVVLTGGGPDAIVAVYSGDAVYNPATSDSAAVVVNSPFNFNADTTSQTINPGATATFNIVLSASGGFAGQVSFTCAGAPAGSTCTVNPNPATLNAKNSSVPITVTISNASHALLNPGPFKTLPLGLAGVLAIVMGLKRNPKQRLFLLVAGIMVISLTACGSRVVAPPPTNATVTVTGTTATGFTNSIDLNLTVN